jgi:hypothetical protein
MVSEKVKIILTNFCEKGYWLGAETKWDRVKPVNGDLNHNLQII